MECVLLTPTYSSVSKLIADCKQAKFEIENYRGELEHNAIFMISKSRTAKELSESSKKLPLIAALLCQEGVNPAFEDSNKQTALFYAASNAHTELCEFLISQKLLNVNHIDCN